MERSAVSGVGLVYRVFMTSQTCSACDQVAGWSCPMCGPRCAGHVRRRRERQLRFACDGCRQEATLLRVRRSDTTTFRDRLKPALVGTLLGRPVLAVGLVALVLSSSLWVGMFGLLLGFVPLAVLAARYARTTADGEVLTWPDFSDAADEVVAPLARFSATAAPLLVLLFFGIQVSIVAPWTVEAQRLQSLTGALLTGPTFWLAVLPTLALLPAVIGAAFLADAWWEGLTPRRISQLFRHGRREYGWMVLVAGAGFLVTTLVRWLSSPGWLGLYVASFVATYAVFAVARLVGEVVWLNPDAFGWGRADEAWVELGDPDAPALEPEAREVTAPPVALSSTVGGQLQAALDARDVALIVDLFVKHSAEAQSLPAPLLLRVGQAAASVNEYATAMDALLAAAKGSGDESARALVIAGRILDERLRDHAGAKRIYEQVIARFDGTPAAKWVREQLADPRFFLAVR